MKEKDACERSLTSEQEAAVQRGVAAEVRIHLEKLPGQADYHRSIEASSVPAAYNGVAVLIRDMAEMMEQPLEHVVAVLATVLLAPAARQGREGGFENGEAD